MTYTKSTTYTLDLVTSPSKDAAIKAFISNIANIRYISLSNSLLTVATEETVDNA